MFGADALEGVIGMPDAIDLVEWMGRHEAAGRTFISPRLTTRFEGGWMRMMFAADYESGYAATRAVHMIDGVGVRYLVSLYRLEDGELLAMLDGRLITDLRTGAASGVAARHVYVGENVTVALIGSGHQARMQLEGLATVYRVKSAVVFSPTREHREKFARDMTVRLEFPVTPVESAEAAVRGANVVVTATSSMSGEPVVRGEWLDRCRLLCAVGSTRPQSVEIDVRCFERSGLILVDSPHAYDEAGDLKNAIRADAAPDSRRESLARLAAGEVAVPMEGMVLFKSVGTALQDLALSIQYFEMLGELPHYSRVAELGSLKQPVGGMSRPPHE
jgi:ornithine cyclodeaminase/alanine dehydrogenase